MAKEVQLHELFTIARPRPELYAAWRDPAHMTRFMPHLRSATALDEHTVRLVAKDAEGSSDVIWDSEFVDDPTSGTLSWKTVEGAPVKHEGRVTFAEVPGGRGTVIGVSLKYHASDDDSAPKIATVVGKEPARKIREELRRFKQLMEAGEIPSVEGQSSGRASEEVKG